MLSSTMTYSQKSLIRLFKIEGPEGERNFVNHIETVISNVFVFEETVYKVYKNDNDFFNKAFKDLSLRPDRFDFTKKDFAWNQKLNGAIYLSLIPVRVRKQRLEVCTEEEAEELLAKMKRVDPRDVLFERLMRDEVTEDECFSMGKQFAEHFKKIRALEVPSVNYHENFGRRINDLHEWAGAVEEYIPKKEWRDYARFLESFRDRHREWFEKELGTQMAHGGDVHSHNITFSKGVLYLMDTYPPKDEWLIQHHLVPLYRIGTDIWALSGDLDLFEAFVKGYEIGMGEAVDRRLDDLFIIYASAIAVSYLYMLQKADPEKKESARRFHHFIRSHFEKVKHKYPNNKTL